LVPTIGIYEVKRENNKVFSFSFIQATELRREGAVTEEEKFLDFYRIFTSFLRRRKKGEKEESYADVEMEAFPEYLGRTL
jgi:hypothetical protein